MSYTLADSVSPQEMFVSGHNCCAGCGQAIAFRNIMNAAGPETIVLQGTGCLEVTTCYNDVSAFRLPWMHSLFENSAALATGVLASLKNQNKSAFVIAQGGDGSSFDIGFGLISGAWARGDDFLYICYDNEGYMNTGYQKSGSSPLGSSTSTAPSGSKIAGNQYYKKDMVKIALAHGCTYVATAGIHNVLDLANKIKKAKTIPGPKYLQVLVPCIPGWKIKADSAVSIAELAFKTGLYPLEEYEYGQLTKVQTYGENVPPVTDYLFTQKRFAHLKDNSEMIAKIQAIAETNIARSRAWYAAKNAA